MQPKTLRRLLILTLLCFFPPLVLGLGNPAGSGLILVPRAQILAPGEFSLDFGIEGVRGEDLYRIPSSLGFRLGVLQGLEVEVFGGAIFQTGLEVENQGTLGFSLKTLIVEGPVTGGYRAFGLSLGGLYRHDLKAEVPVADTRWSLFHDDGNFPGFAGAIILESRRGALSLHLASDLRTGPILPPNSEILDNPRSWGSWIYLRGGVGLDLGIISGGISGALRTQTLGSAKDALAPGGAFAYEALFTIPGTQLSLGAYGRTLIVQEFLPYTYSGLLIKWRFPNSLPISGGAE